MSAYRVRFDVPTTNGVVLAEEVWLNSEGAVKNFRAYAESVGWNIFSEERVEPTDSTSAINNLFAALKAARIEPKIATAQASVWKTIPVATA